jgi:nucleotide-binding universal stress UspA family protein
MTSSKFQILVPTDFSEQSISAFYQSCRISKLYDADITLLHVVENEDEWNSKWESSSRVELLEKIDKKIKEFVKAELGISKKIVSCDIEFGNAAERIIELQKKRNFDMIVMGFNEQRDVLQKQIGQNAMEVIKNASCQVVAVKNKINSGDFKSIILPLDLAKPVIQKITKAIELAKAWKGAVVNIISVLPVCDELKAITATQQLASIVKEVEANNIICNAEIIRMIKGHETMADIVVDYAQRVKCEIVMIVTRHEIGIANRLGSAAQSIINSIEIPMFSIVPLIDQN